MAKKETKEQKKIHSCMHKFKVGELKSGKTDKPVESREQAVAIALHEAGVSKEQMAKKEKNNGEKKKGK